MVRPANESVYIMRQLMEKRAPPIPDSLQSQPEACKFIALCLKPDLNERPSAKDLLQHPYPRVHTGTNFLFDNSHLLFFSLET